MRKALLTLALVGAAALCAAAQTPETKPVAATAVAPATSAPAADPAVVVKPVSNKIVPNSKVYIQPMDGFENYLVAALQKKKVQLLPVAEKDQADYVITGTSLNCGQESRLGQDLPGKDRLHRKHPFRQCGQHHPH